MFFLHIKFAKPIKLFFLAFFSIFSSVSLSAIEYPKHLSEDAKISLISIYYDDISHTLFSKNCLRIYDKENQFDTIIDFASFEDFDNTFFGLKFFLKNKKAFIKSEEFFKFFLAEKQKKNTSISEISLNLSQKETAYIYDFLYKLHKALPEYSYDFDILTNNSETHISLILHDCYRMVGSKSTNDRYSFSDITKLNLSYKKINDSYVLLSDKEKLNFNKQDFSKIYSPHQKELTILLIIICSLFFIVTCYQMLVCFFEKLYVSSIFKSSQIFDFTILFSSGLSGMLIIFMDLFSNQAMLRNNIEFMYLFPLNIIAAFFVFKPISTKKRRMIYWIVVSALSVIYIAIVWIMESKLPIINLLFVLPLFLRTVYFALVTKTSNAMYAPPGIPA